MTADDIETANDGNYGSNKGNYDKIKFFIRKTTAEYLYFFFDIAK